MIIEKFTQFIMHRRLNAIIAAMVFAFLPFLHWLSVVIVALVTLRKGWLEGFLILIWAALPFFILLFLGHWVPFVSNVLFGSVFVWCLAIILRRTSNWMLTIKCAAGVCILGVLMIHFIIPTIATWWAQQISGNFEQFIHILHLQLTEEQVKDVAHLVAPYATGLQGSIIVLVALVELIIARVLQARLFNPGGFKKEWLNLRFNYLAMIIFAVIVFLGWYGPVIFKDILPVIALPFLLTGISLVHGLLNIANVSSFWVFGFYLLLLLAFVFMPILLGVVILLAMIDSLFDFRSKLLSRKLKDIH